MDSKLLLARVQDTLDAALRSGKPRFLGFLSNEELVLATRFLDNQNARYLINGGFETAERTFICCLPDWADETDFPITAVTFTFRKNDILRHRDFLGSLMALGIKREAVGDILIESGRSVVFLTEEICDFVLKNISKIGKVGVIAKNGFELPLPQKDDLLEKTVTISSCRLDCVVSAVAGISRNTATEFINNGFVCVNSVVCEKVTKQVLENDILSVRTKGKFQISSLAEKTKKQRIILVYKTY